MLYTSGMNVRSNNKILTQKAFTLIELLVVISIIGLLSSIVLASVTSAREKARLAAARSFATAQYRAFGADTVLGFNFNESSGNPIDEVSGFACTLAGNAARSSDNPTGIGNSLSLDGTGDYCTVGVTAGSLPTTIMNEGGKYTVGLWYKPSGLPVGTTVYFFPRTTFFGGLYLNASNQVRLGLYYAGGTSSFGLTPSNRLTAGQWHHLAYSVDTIQNKVELYLDGQSIASGTLANDVYAYSNSTGYFIGGVSAGNLNANGLIDDVRLYSQAFTLAEIQKLYAEGLETKQLAQNN